MKFIVYPLGKDGECLPLPTPVFIRVNEESLKEWTLTLTNQIKTAISRNILSASDADYPQWVQALHAINSQRVLLVSSNDPSHQYVFQDVQAATAATPTALEVISEEDNSLPGMINRRAQILRTLQDLDDILLERLNAS